MKAHSKQNLITTLVFLGIPLAAGALSALISMPSSPSDIYASLEQPPLSPPAFLFPIVWTVLYILMGVSSYLVYQSDASTKSDALFNYGVQLFVNILWPLLFFRFSAILPALVWLIFLWILVFHMIKQFTEISRIAGWLQIPYLTWLTFAGYLNAAIYLLNR